MVFIPWAEFGICRHHMIKIGSCYAGAENCRWHHPVAGAEWQKEWERRIAEQNVAAERGVPRPVKPRMQQGGAAGGGVQGSVQGIGQPLAQPLHMMAPPQFMPPSPQRMEPPQQRTRTPLAAGLPPGGYMLGVFAMPPVHLQPRLPENASSANSEPVAPRRSRPGPDGVSGWRQGTEGPRDQSKSMLGGMVQRHNQNDDREEGEVEESGVEMGADDPESRLRDNVGNPGLEPQSTTAWNDRLQTNKQTQRKMNGTKRTSNGEPKHVGPHPSTIRVATPFMSQGAIEELLHPATGGQLDVQERSNAEARENSVRLQGVTWLDNVRRALQLPIRTYTRACFYYHQFRLAHPGFFTVDNGNAWVDVCAASLLKACKVEDTLKKSRDILAAAYNLKAASAHEQLPADDPFFEQPSRIIIGLERRVLEAGRFDFRSKDTHKLMTKMSKLMPAGEDDENKNVHKLAWTIMTDLHRTFAPLKQTHQTMAVACIELSAHLHAASTPNNTSAVRDELQQFDYQKWHTSREQVMETLLDLLDLYTDHAAATILGSKFSPQDFVRIRLAFNKESSENNLPRYTSAPPKPNGSGLRVANGHPTPVSPAEAHAQQQNGVVQTQAQQDSVTTRFMLNPQLAADEQVEVQRYFVDEWEEYEEEVEVPIARPPRSDRGSDREGQRGGRQDRDRERDRLRDREREVERERAALRGSERERGRFDDRDRRFDDRRWDDRRGGRYEDDRRRRR